MSDINRMLDDLLDTQPHRSDLRQNIVVEFELMEARLADERKHGDELAYLLSVYKHAYDSDNRMSGAMIPRALDALAAHTEMRKS